MRSVFVGLGIALVQSILTTVALAWAWNRKYFYWVWGAMFFFRCLVFAGTAFWVYKYTQLSFTFTLISLVVGTTVFMVVESYVFLRNKNGFSTST